MFYRSVTKIRSRVIIFFFFNYLMKDHFVEYKQLVSHFMTSFSGHNIKFTYITTYNKMGVQIKTKLTLKNEPPF